MQYTCAAADSCDLNVERALCGRLGEGIVSFAALFRWGLWAIRYHVPGFALAAPLVATAWPQRWSDARKTAALCLFLGLSSSPVLLLNQSRQLVPIARD